MPMSLADLRKEKDRPASLPTRLVRICLDQSILSDVQRLTAERADLIVSSSLEGDDEKDGPPRRMGQRGVPPRVAEIDAELEPIYERLRQAEGELLLRAVDGGTWLRWKDEHPAREDSEIDNRLTFGFCNAADLADDLGRYVVSWNGEEFGPGEWDGWFRGKVAPADIGECVKAVVEMHEVRVNAPKSPSSSSATTTDAPD